jgi:thiamine-phosphate pyrophosphorylase
MKLYVLSKDVAVTNEAQIINNLFANGLEHLHLRKPETSKDELADLLSQIEPVYYERIALHQFHDLAEEFGIRRLHFTTAHRKHVGQHELLKYSDAGYTLSTSVHTWGEIKGLENFNALFYSPVFDSLSKPGYGGTLTNDFRLEDNYKERLIALGGISIDNIKETKTMGFRAAAVLGAIWNDPSTAPKNFVDLKKHLQECNSSNPRSVNTILTKPY